MHRFLWSGIAFLPLVLRAGIGNLCGIGWGRGLVLMVLGGPVMSLISYSGFLFVPLGHGSVIQPSCATLGGLFLAAALLKEQFRFAGVRRGRHRRRPCVIGAELIGHIGPDGVLGDLIFVLTGLMFAVFGTLLRHWRVSAFAAATVISVLSLSLLPLYAYPAGPAAWRRSASVKTRCKPWGRGSWPAPRRCTCSRSRSSFSASPAPPCSRRWCRR